MKRLLALILAVVLCISMCACSNGGGSSEGPQKITISHCQGEWSWPILDGIAADFTKQTGIEVELLYVAADSYNQWQQAQLAANNEPDIIWGMTNPKEVYKSGKIMDLTEYYEKESPFSGRKWKDDYIDGMLADCYDESGERMIANVILTITQNLYYNKTIFNELGLEVPKTWSDVLECSKVIKEAGYIPFSLMNSVPSYNIGPMSLFISEDLFYNSGKLEKLDIITPNGKIDTAEAMLGVKTGVIKYTDEEFVTLFKLLKDMEPYFNVGYNSASFEYEALFNEGKSAMTINGSWFPNQDYLGDFPVDYGVTLIPYVDSSIYANARNREAKYKASAPAGEIVVTKKAEDEGRSEAAIKFLQFLSDAKSAGDKWVQGTMFLPVMKDVDLPELMKPFEDFYGTDELAYRCVGFGTGFLDFDTEIYSEYNKMLADYLEEDIAPETFAQNVQKLYDGYIDDAIEMSSVDIKSYIDKVK